MRATTGCPTNMASQKTITRKRVNREQFIQQQVDYSTGTFESYPLHKACEFGMTATVERLLSGGWDPNARGMDSRTPMYYASLGNHMEAAIMLLGCGADCSIADDLGNTPFHIACWKGNVRMVEFFLERTNVSLAMNKDKKVPFHLAALSDSTATMATLIDAFPYWNNKTVPQSAEDIEAGIPPVQLYSPKMPTPFAMACMCNKEGMIRLMANHLDINGKDDNSRLTRLGRELLPPHGNAASLLLELGADPNQPVDDRYLPLEMAISWRRYDAFKALLAHGADPKPPVSKIRQLPLQAACNRGHIEMVKDLLALGADPLLVDDNEITPFYAAFHGRHLDCMKLIYEVIAKIDPESVFRHQCPRIGGYTFKPIMMALVIKPKPYNLEMHDFLISIGFTSDCITETGETLLHLVSKRAPLLVPAVFQEMLAVHLGREIPIEDIVQGVY